jgi:hypothetical protein
MLTNPLLRFLNKNYKLMELPYKKMYCNFFYKKVKENALLLKHSLLKKGPKITKITKL